MKHTFFAFALWLSFTNLFGQVEEPLNPGQENQKEKLSFKERLVFGGDIGLSFGTITYIKLAPVVGYRITDRLTAGVGPIYIYEKYKDFGLESSTYGGKAVASFAVLKGTESGGIFPLGTILLHAENEILNVEPAYEVWNSILGRYEFIFDDRIWIDNLLLGFGLMQPIAGRFSVSMFLLWDVTGNPYSPYSNPILKLGFNF